MIKNSRTKKVLSKDVRVYEGVGAKALGLMFRFTAPTFTVHFPFSSPRIVAIHMWFVFFPLDILWLDARGKVVDMQTLCPWTFYTPKKRATDVLELPAGTITRTQTKLGDRISGI
jgi:uncharacterized membrane protein (UPF0127 family)